MLMNKSELGFLFPPDSKNVPTSKISNLEQIWPNYNIISIFGLKLFVTLY